MRQELPTLTGGIEVALGPKSQSYSNLPPPFFGRGQDLETLRHVADTVRTKLESRCVTVVGPAGIGKTRLLDEFVAGLRRIDDRPVRVFRSVAVDGTTWCCFTQLLSQRFGVADALGPEEAKLGVRAHVAALLDDRKVGDVVYVLGEMLGLEFPDSPFTKALADGALDTSLPKRAVLKSLLEADASSGPLCLVLDDLHLCHEQTVSMLHFLVENLNAPVLFLCAARPELLARHEDRPANGRYSVVHLEALGEVDTAALIGTLLSPGGLTPMHVVEQAREVTGGNPGRIEETARHYRHHGTLPPPPAGPESAVDTRIDELAPAERLLLQRAALMGGVFWFGGLVVLDRADRDPPVLWNEEDDESRLDITERLQRLTERDYILRLPDSTFPGDEEYVFRHRVERERIARLTSPPDARKWHRLLADWLDSKPEIRTHEEYLEMLAEQREKSGISDWAARAYLEAAGRSRANGVIKRELAYYDKALSLLGEHDYGRRLDSLLRSGELLESLNKTEAALDRYREALILAFRLDRRPSWVAARLAATRLLAKLGRSDESMSHLESAPPPEVLMAATPEPPAPSGDVPSAPLFSAMVAENRASAPEPTPSTPDVAAPVAAVAPNDPVMSLDSGDAAVIIVLAPDSTPSHALAEVTEDMPTSTVVLPESTMPMVGAVPNLVGPAAATPTESAN